MFHFMPLLVFVIAWQQSLALKSEIPDFFAFWDRAVSA
jgi:hypothetical protein